MDGAAVGVALPAAQQLGAQPAFEGFHQWLEPVHVGGQPVGKVALLQRFGAGSAALRTVWGFTRFVLSGAWLVCHAGGGAGLGGRCVAHVAVHLLDQFGERAAAPGLA